MKGIKTRETRRDIKALDKAAEAGKSMKQAFIRTKDHAGNVMDDGQESPGEYAEDRIKYAAEDTVHEVGHKAKKEAGKAKDKVRDQLTERHKRKQAEKRQETLRHRTEKAGRDASVQKMESGVRQHQVKTRTAIRRKNHTIKTAAKTEKGIKQTARSTGKATVKTAQGTVKTTQKTIKTAEQTSKVAVKTTKAAAETAKKTAQATAKAAKQAAILAKKAAIAAYKAAVVAAKAIAAAVKAIIAGIKALIAAIAAGGWVSVVVILLICLIGLIVGSCFGIFFSSEDTGSEKTMQEVVREINLEYQNTLDDLKASTPHDEVEMSGSSAVWREVLSVYAVKATTDEENPQEVASLSEEKIRLLKEIFWEMNEISTRTETHTVTKVIETADEEGNIIEETVEEVKTTLYITVSHQSADAMAGQYGFSEDQKQQLADLLDEKNRSIWSAVLYGIKDGDAQIVEVALSQLGNVGGEPYWSWYGFNSRVEWCACFVSWCANECGYIEDGIIPKYAGCDGGMNWFKARGQWLDGTAEPVPGMIIFFDWDSPNGSAGPQDGSPDHTGIVERVEDGYVYTVEGNSSDSCRQKRYSIGNYQIIGYGVPAY